MKRVLSMILVVGLILATVGCGKKTVNDEASAAVTNFLSELKKGDFKKATEYVVDGDEFELADDDQMLTTMFGSIKYEVLSVEGSDDEFTVKIKVKHPDFEQLTKVIQAQAASLLESAMASAADGDSESNMDPEQVAKQINDAMTKALEEDNSVIESESEIKVKKVDGKYKISDLTAISQMFGM